MPTPLCGDCQTQLGLPSLPPATPSTPVYCQNNELVVPAIPAPFDPCSIEGARPIGSARFDVLAFTALNVAGQTPLNPAPVAPGAAAQWNPAIGTRLDLSWTNDLGCDAGIAIGYDMGFVVDTFAHLEAYRFAMAVEYQVNAGPNNVHAAVFCATTFVVPNPLVQVTLRTLGVGSANPLGNPANEALPAVVLSPGDTITANVFAFHWLEAGVAQIPGPAAIREYTTAARFYAFPNWV